MLGTLPNYLRQLSCVACGSRSGLPWSSSACGFADATCVILLLKYLRVERGFTVQHPVDGATQLDRQ